MCKVPKAECAAGDLNRGGSAGETRLGEGGREDERDLMRGRIREKETESVCTCVRERGRENRREREEKADRATKQEGGSETGVSRSLWLTELSLAPGSLRALSCKLAAPRPRSVSLGGRPAQLGMFISSPGGPCWRQQAGAQPSVGSQSPEATIGSQSPEATR